MSFSEIKFQDFITLQRGFDLPVTKMKEGDVPVLGSNSIVGYHNEAKVEPPGVVTGRSGTLGMVQFTDKPYWPHNTSLWVKDFKGNDPKFIFYKLQTLKLERFNGGASVPTLNRNVLDTLKISIPGINEQQKIASVLSAYDSLIENNRRRMDIMGFVNGIPLLFIELKNVHKNLQAAYEKNLSDYRDTVPHLFHHNAIIVLANGVEAKLGSYSSQYKHFLEWKRLEETEPGVVDMETLLKGVFDKLNFMDMFENFIVFDDSTGKLVKILARNHQFLGVNRAIKAVIERKERKGKLGIFWHTQGAGKSYSMVFFTRKIHRKLGGNFTFLVCTDRDDLDSQIYKTFAGCKLVDNDKDPCRAESGERLQQMLGEHKAYVFTLIQKFNKKIADDDPTHTGTIS